MNSAVRLTVLGLGLAVVTSAGAQNLALLAGPGLSRNPYLQPSADQLAAAAAYDRSVGQLATTHRYDALIARLKERAGIDARVPVKVFVDQQNDLDYSGGFTTLNTIYLDGKLIDILADFGRYLAIRPAGVGSNMAIDAVVAAHNSQRGRAAEAPIFGTNVLTDSQQNIVDTYLQDTVGLLLYHEFGHFWRCSPIQPIPTAEEDAADVIAGYLVAKSGIDPMRAREVIDLLNFQSLQRYGLLSSITEVTSSLSSQAVKPLARYSTQMVRKTSVLAGYGAYERPGTVRSSGKPIKYKIVGGKVVIDN